MVLPFWYRLTRVVPAKGPLNGCVCVCVVEVFVANPNKPRAVQEILLRNRDKLVEFLSRFHNDRAEDDQFNDEKAYLIKQIKEMKPPPGDVPSY